MQYHVPYYYYHVLPWRLIITASLQRVPHSLLVIFSFLFLLFVNTSAYGKCNFTVEKINKSCCHVSGSQRNTSYEFLSISLKFTQDVQIPSSRERQFETICLHAAPSTSLSVVVSIHCLICWWFTEPICIFTSTCRNPVQAQYSEVHTQHWDHNTAQQQKVTWN